MVVDDETTVADIDEALANLVQRRRAGARIVHDTLTPRIDKLLDARNELTHAADS